MATPSTSATTDLQQYIGLGTFIIGSLFGGIFTWIKMLIDIRYQGKNFRETQNSKEREEIRRQLNNFYGPFKEIRTESRLLYSVFALKEKADEKGKGKYFRTLRYLAQKYAFEESDAGILDAILTLGQRQIDMIEKEGATISNPSLAELLGKLGAHVRLLLLTREKNFGPIADSLESLVFPLEIDGAIESEIRRLQKCRDERLSTPAKKKKRVLPSELNSSIKYYDSNSNAYLQATLKVDMSAIYKKFRDQIPMGCLILDAGCGVGRDTRYFINHGYRVVSIDASPEMVKLCSRYPFAYCEDMAFSEIPYIEEFDAIWACASLVHLDYDNLKTSMMRLATALKPKGIFYFSLKKVSGIASEDGRYFYNIPHATLLTYLKDELSFEIIENWENQSQLDSGTDQWMNYLLRKK